MKYVFSLVFDLLWAVLVGASAGIGFYHISTFSGVWPDWLMLVMSSVMGTFTLLQIGYLAVLEYTKKKAMEEGRMR